MESEEAIPGLREGKAATREAGKRTYRERVEWKGATLDVAVHEFGSGRRNRLVVMLHGIFSDHETWRFVAGYLAENYDLMLIDLPGSGVSDHPDPEQMPDDLFAPPALASMILQAVAQRLAARRSLPREIALIGHSYGGTVALQMFDAGIRRDYARIMRRVDRLVLFAPLDLALEEPDAVMRRLMTLGEWEVDLTHRLGLLKELGSQGMRASMVVPERAPREEVDRSVVMLVEDGLRTGMQAMVRQFFVIDEEGNPDRDTIAERGEIYAEVRVPTLIIWGTDDATLPVEMGSRIVQRLPQGQLEIWKPGKHSMHVEYPKQTAERIERFLGD